MYTTKAAGSDKKLYKNIENSLESQYASLLTFSAGLPPSQAKEAGAALNLSRASPFGSLSQISSRRTFAYLIATLNASHPDYDFSHLLRPSDFRRETSARKVMSTLNSTLEHLRPLNVPTISSIRGTPATGIITPLSSGRWTPQFWDLLDKQMIFRSCSVYNYAPEDDPFSDSEDEASLWSFNYFFFNKEKKRVCYVYLRGLSLLGNETPGGAKTPTSIVTVRPKRPASATWSVAEEETWTKRARFWLGDRAENAIVVADDDDEGQVEVVGHKETDGGVEGDSEKEDEAAYFERLSDTASASPCKGRSRERSSSAMRSRSKDTETGGSARTLRSLS